MDPVEARRPGQRPGVERPDPAGSGELDCTPKRNRDTGLLKEPRQKRLPVTDGHPVKVCVWPQCANELLVIDLLHDQSVAHHAREVPSVDPSRGQVGHGAYDGRHRQPVNHSPLNGHHLAAVKADVVSTRLLAICHGELELIGLEISQIVQLRRRPVRDHLRPRVPMPFGYSTPRIKTHPGDTEAVEWLRRCPGNSVDTMAHPLERALVRQTSHRLSRHSKSSRLRRGYQAPLLRGKISKIKHRRQHSSLRGCNSNA